MAITAAPDVDRLLETLRGTILSLVRQDDTDLTARQLAVFLTCYLDSEPQTVRGLAQALNVSKAGTCRVLDGLEEGGLLRRKADPRDRRSVLTARTAAGSTLLRDLRQIVTQAAQASGLSE